MVFQKMKLNTAWELIRQKRKLGLCCVLFKLKQLSSFTTQVLIKDWNIIFTLPINEIILSICFSFFPFFRSNTHKLSIVIGIVAIIWVLLFGLKNPLTLKSDFLHSYNSSFCIIDHNEASLEFVRPVTNCTAMCAGLTDVPRFDSISREAFINDFAYSGRPLVVTGGTKNWTAMKVFNFDYFKNLYGKYEDAYDVQEEGSCQFFAYKTEFGSLEDVFRMSKRRANLKGKPWYIGWQGIEDF